MFFDRKLQNVAIQSPKYPHIPYVCTYTFINFMQYYLLSLFSVVVDKY